MCPHTLRASPFKTLPPPLATPLGSRCYTMHRTCTLNHPKPYLYLNSVSWMPAGPGGATPASPLPLLDAVAAAALEMVSTKREKAPARSGMVVVSVASVRAPTLASSETRRSRSKLMLAPDVMATTVLPCWVGAGAGEHKLVRKGAGKDGTCKGQTVG